MRRMITLAVLAAFAGTQAFAAGPKLTAENTKIEFTGTKKDGSHNGGFKQLSGSVEMPGDDLTQAVIKVEIVTDSIYTDNNMLTRHLKSPDFFDVRTHPKATFTATAIRAVRSDQAVTHLMTGNLSLHGVTKPTTIQMKRGGPITMQGKQRIGFEGTIEIHLKDFNVGKPDQDLPVRVMLSLEATK